MAESAVGSCSLDQCFVERSVSTQESSLQTSSEFLKRGRRVALPNSDRRAWHLNSLEREMQDVVSQHVAPARMARLIDFGCGNMPYRPMFSPHVSEYIGCDFPDNDCCDAHLAGPDQLPFADASACCVLSSQVLEHVEEPAAYLSEARRVLRDGGLLILSTHGVWRYHPDPIDLWRWTSAGLQRQLDRAGFEVLECRGIMGPAATALQLLQDATMGDIPRPFRSTFIRFMQWRMRRADARCTDLKRNRDACVYLTVSRVR
jgi:SAM-dependent methyltransferase